MREIRGWNVAQVVTANEMTLNTANVYEQTGANAEANLPCIYNGLDLFTQTGGSGEIITLNPGVCRCEDLPLSIYTYLPPNSYGTSYPCFIDISALDSNQTITLNPATPTGYIVATFSISPNTPAAVNYVITGSLLQIATGVYDPQIHVRLCAFDYVSLNFILDFSPGVGRDTDFTGPGGIQWDFQNNSLVLDNPQTQSGSLIVLKQNTIINGLLGVDSITDVIGSGPPDFPHGIMTDTIVNSAGTGPVDFPHGITEDSFMPPIPQVISTGTSGTYITPVNPSPLYLHLEMTAGGGGASGSGVSGATGGSSGGITSFGPNISCVGGGGATPTIPGGGGTASFSGAGVIGINYDGQAGAGGMSVINASVGSPTIIAIGGYGGQNPFAGSGRGGYGFSGAAVDGQDNTGAGGGGGGMDVVGNSASGSAGQGGGSGGYLDVLIQSPALASTFLWARGVGGNGGSPGVGGTKGGAGGSGILIITAHFQ